MDGHEAKGIAEAAGRFTERYVAITAIDLGGMAWWEACVAREQGPRIAHWGLAADAERTMRERLSMFVREATEKLRV